MLSTPTPRRSIAGGHQHRQERWWQDLRQGPKKGLASIHRVTKPMEWAVKTAASSECPHRTEKAQKGAGIYVGSEKVVLSPALVVRTLGTREPMGCWELRGDSATTYLSYGDHAHSSCLSSLVAL